MAITGTVRASGTLLGLAGGSKQLEIEWVIGTGIANIQSLTFATNTTVTIPSGTTLLVIVPPTGNANALTLKGVAGDTGVAMHKTKPTIIALDSSPTVVVNAGASTVCECWFI